MEKERKKPQYKTVLEVQAIMDSSKSKNKKLLALRNWKYDYTANGGRIGCRIAEDIIDKWVLENFGEENYGKVERNFMKKFPLQFERFKQVEGHGTGRLEEELYRGFWREEGKAYCEFLNPVLSLIPRLYDLKKESQIEDCFGKISPKIKAAIEKLEAKFKRQVTDYKKFKKETGLPLRFLGGEFKGTLAEFQEKKSNLEYLKFEDTHIVIEKIEHYTKEYRQYQHGVGRLESTERAILLSRKGKITRYPLKTFAGEFLLKFLKEQFPDYAKSWYTNDEVEQVKLDNCFSVYQIESPVKKAPGKFYKRLFNDRIWDYCYVEDGVTYHASTIDGACKGYFEKIKKLEEFEKQKQDAIKKEAEIWTLKKAHERLGFCETGIKRFCELNNLDPDGAYSYAELREVIKKRLADNLYRFRSELKTMFKEFD